ncbi:MAG: peroxiredoxin family protein [Pyrinomonadaceae bacterium]
MSKRKYSASSVILFSIMFGVICVLVTWSYIAFRSENKNRVDVKEESKRLVGKQVILSEFATNTFQKGMVSADVNKNSVLLVYLLESCSKCQKEVLMLNQLVASKGLSIPVVGVMGEEETVVKEYVEKLGINFPILLDKSRKFAAQNRLVYFPSNFLVVNGEIRRVFLGVPKRSEELQEFAK